MIRDCNDLDERTKDVVHYQTSQSEGWGQPPASNYIFTVIDGIMYGQFTGSSYIVEEQSIDTLLGERLIIPDVENNSWLALAQSAFNFWDNDQDAFFDSL
jgi:hypothetical protein